MFGQIGPLAQSLESYQFSQFSDLNLLNGVTNGLVTLPNGLTVAPELDYGDTFDFEARYAPQAQVDSFFPNGAYQVRLETVHDGIRTFNLNLTGDAYPNAPQIVNFPATQSVNPSNAFVLSWGAFAGGAVSDFIAVELKSQGDFSSEGAFDTPGIGESGALNGTHTSVTIPAFTFAPGRRYAGELIFARMGQTDTTTYPGAIGASLYFSGTLFELQAIGTPIRPSLQISNLGNSVVRIMVTGERNRFYTVESTDSLLGNPVFWQPRFNGVANSNITGFTGSCEFQDGVLSLSGSRFYRVREGADFGGGP